MPRAKIYYNSILVFSMILLNVCICCAEKEDAEPKGKYRISIKDLKLSKQEAIQAAEVYLTEHKYNKYYVLSKPRRIKEDFKNWIIYFPQRGKTSDASFDLRAIVNIMSVKVEIDKTYLGVMSSRHHDESLLGTEIVTKCTVIGVNSSTSGCILYLGGFGSNRLEALIPKDDLQKFFDKCGLSVEQIAAYYAGKSITITGVLEKIEGKPMIVVHSPGQMGITSPINVVFPESKKGTHGSGGFFGKF